MGVSKMVTSKGALPERDDSFYSDLSALLGVVLHDVATDEALVLTKLGPAFLQNAQKSHGQSELRGVASEFSSVIELGFITVHVMAGTLALIDLYLHARRIEEDQEARAKLHQEWVSL